MTDGAQERAAVCAQKLLEKNRLSVEHNLAWLTQGLIGYAQIEVAQAKQAERERVVGIATDWARRAEWAKILQEVDVLRARPTELTKPTIDEVSGSVDAEHLPDFRPNYPDPDPSLLAHWRPTGEQG